MMTLETFKLTLLDSLYYNSVLDSGAAGAVVSVHWVGDIAITYAICRSLSIGNLSSKITSTPHYEELLDSLFIASVAHSIDTVKMLPIYDFSTSFMSEGYYDYVAFNATRNSPFRNWIRKQGIAAGNVFYFSIAYRNHFSLPDSFSIRLGNMRSCIARVDKIKGDVLSDYDIWGNAYTADLIRKRWNTGSDPISSPTSQREMLSSYYVVVKGLDQQAWGKLVSPFE